MFNRLIFITLSFISLPLFAVSKCPSEWNHLKNIQSQLRHDSNEYLRNKERKAHKIYQACRKNKNITTSVNKSYNHNDREKYLYNKRLNSYTASKKHKKEGNAKAIFKGFFKGEKQDAWIKYYRTPKECKRPKSTSQFANCIEIKKKASEVFSNEWERKKIKWTPIKIKGN